MLVNLHAIDKYYNGKLVLDDVNLSIEDNDRIGLIGENGCGKTTLLRILTKSENPDRKTEQDGIITISNKTTIGYLAQNSGLDNSGTVIEEMRNVFSKLYEASDRLRVLEEIMSADDAHNDEAKFKLISDEYSHLTAYFESNEGYLIDVKIKTILNGMGFGDDSYNRVVNTFSGGEKTRLAICRLLLEEPNLLILDEPTNHLDFQTVMWLEDYLKDYRGALLIVSHDRYFLDKICKSICEIDRGKLTRFKGNYSAYTVLKEELVNRQQKEYEAQQKQIAKLEDYVAKNLVRASTSKSAKSRVKQLEKIEHIDKPIHSTKKAKVNFEFAYDPPIDLLSVKSIDVSVGAGNERKTLVDNLNFEVKRGEKIAIIGENGKGKSTLLKIIQNKLPHKGIVNWASNVRISYFDQENAQLNKSNTVFDEIKNRYPTMNDLDVRNLLGKVRITGENVFKQVGVISGGERAKLCFGLMMLEKGNVLILDEPTNHLDLVTKEVLEEGLCEYEGTIIFVSHDRYFVNKISTKILEISDNKAEMFAMGFDRYIEMQTKLRDEERIASEKEKQLKQQKLYEEKNAKSYRTKEQRSQDAKKRNRIKELDTIIEQLQMKIDSLKQEITCEDVYSDFKLMHEKCLEIEEAEKDLEDKYEEWFVLSEEMG